MFNNLNQFNLNVLRDDINQVCHVNLNGLRRYNLQTLGLDTVESFVIKRAADLLATDPAGRLQDAVEAVRQP